jgi:hypothetical protein
MRWKIVCTDVSRDLSGSSYCFPDLDVYYLQKKICNVKCEMMCLFSLNFLDMLSASMLKGLYTTSWFCIMPMP